MKYLFVYGKLINRFDDDACYVKNATTYGMKLGIHKTTQIPCIIPTYNLEDYVDGQIIKICKPETMTKVISIINQLASGFTKKTIQVNVEHKIKEAYVYMPNDLTMYDEITEHSYESYCSSNKK